MAAKNDLIAIYRLEFYKKKKNWKFCQDVCKKDPEPTEEAENDHETKESVISTPIKPELNKTYNIDTKPNEDCASLLNDAFIDGIDNIPPEIPTNPDPDQMDHEVENAWVSCIEDNPHESKQNSWDKPDSPWEWPASGTDYYQHVINSQEDNHHYQPEDYTATVWHSSEQQTTNYTWPKYNIDQGDCCAETTRSNHWTLPNHTAHIYNTDIHERSSSLESLTSFIQGAGCVPHSSEVDVTTTDENMSPVTYCLSLQPEESLHTHTDSLKQLMTKATIREQNTHPHLYQECPTRDPGPIINSESFANSCQFNTLLDHPGKGRGRLMARPGVIAIRMGRPYRIQ